MEYINFTKMKLKTRKLELQLILALMIVIAAFKVNAAGTTNVSILYGWNGSEFVPAEIDAQGRLKTSMNLSRSVGIYPYNDNLYDIGSNSLRWRYGYFYNLQVYGNITLAGNINISGLTFSNGTVQVQTGNFTVDPVDTILFVDTTNNVTGIGTGNPSYLLQTDAGAAGKSVNLSGVVYVNGSNGRVGIGTDNPSYLLQTAAGAAGKSVNLSGVIYANSSSGRVGIGTDNPT